MLKSIIVRIVDFCSWLAWPVIIFAVLLAAAASAYSVRHFAITTDVSQLISTAAPWRQREVAFHRAFPQRGNLILVVVQGPTPELTKQATHALAQRLSGNSGQFRPVPCRAAPPTRRSGHAACGRMF